MSHSNQPAPAIYDRNLLKYANTKVLKIACGTPMRWFICYSTINVGSFKVTGINEPWTV